MKNNNATIFNHLGTKKGLKQLYQTSQCEWKETVQIIQMKPAIVNECNHPFINVNECNHNQVIY